MTFDCKSFLRRVTVCAATLVVASVAYPARAADDLATVLAKLDAASVKFKSAQADIEWDNVQTAPIEDTDKQAGTVLFQRKVGQLAMALHLKTDNGKPVLKDMVYSGGLFKLYEPRLKQMNVYKAGANQAQAEAIMTVGFGGSGKDLQKNWQISYSGTEQVEGNPAAKLELVPLTDSLKKDVAKVVLWVSMDNGIAVKQQSFDPSGNYRVVSYHNIRVNAPVPSGAFEIKTASGTQIVNH
jgi:outer membrane lipoprotein-sorting protein